jgi:hypothetical protein
MSILDKFSDYLVEEKKYSRSKLKTNLKITNETPTVLVTLVIIIKHKLL